jgi:hypothetical protein
MKITSKLIRGDESAENQSNTSSPSDGASCSEFSLLSQFPLGIQNQMKAIVQKNGKDSKISYQTIRIPHPQHPDRTVVLYDNVQLVCD